jgi:ATP-binding cassette subfamily C (CFTR/MRP) protein 1
MTIMSNGTERNTALPSEHGRRLDDDDTFTTADAMERTVVTSNVARAECNSVVNPFLDRIQEQSLEDQANCFSRWTLNYLSPLMKLGTRKILEAEDCGAPSRVDRAEYAYSKVQAAWKKEIADVEAANNRKLKNRAKREPNLTRVLLRSFGVGKFSYAVIVYVISVLLQFVPVLLLTQLVLYLQSGVPGFVNPWLAAVLMGIFPVIVSILQAQHLVIMNHFAVFVRTSCCTLLYNKALCVSPTGRSHTNAGQVMNMMSNDTSQLQRFLQQYIGNFLVAPLQIVIALVLIYQQVQNATWVGAGYMIALAPVNRLIFGVVGKMRVKALKFSE